MACSNCFNGCAEIVSDQCVKYTGIDVPVLGIKNGDSLSYVEQALIEFLTSTLDGTGIKIDIDPQIICTLVQTYLPTCGDLTAVDLFNALIKATCALQVQVTAIASDVADIQDQLTALEGNYTVGCLTGVTATSGTHDILQAVITELCAFITDVETNYVQLADLDTLIADYLATLPVNTKLYTRMIPYTAVEYYGNLVNFDVTGAGTGDWEKIYLCNGLNGTPDKRGVVPVGAIALVPGGPLNSAVNPASSPFNPNYSLGGGIVGSNSITLNSTQIPSHSHSATSTVTPNPHTHDVTVPLYSSSSSGSTNARTAYGTSDNSLTVTSTTVSLAVSTSVGNTGGSLPHANNQPALACYYIMYIP